MKLPKLLLVLTQIISGPVIETLEDENLSLDFILNTHHHLDHVGANLELKNMVVKLSEVREIVLESQELI